MVKEMWLLGDVVVRRCITSNVLIRSFDATQKHCNKTVLLRIILSTWPVAASGFCLLFCMYKK